MTVEQVVIERNTLQHVMDVLLELGGRTSPIPDLEEDIYRLRDNQRLYTIDRIENHNLKELYNAPHASQAGDVSFFLDTHQRTQLIGHFLTPLGLQVPVHYSVIMSLILERTERRFKVWRQPLLRHLVMLPFAFLENRAPVEKARDGVDIVDTGIDQPDYTQLRVQSVQIAYRELTKMKIALLDEWRKATASDGDKYLIHNGTYLEDANTDLDPRVIGWSKTVYLPFKGAKEADVKHLELASFQRSSVFRLSREDDGGATTKYAWFIKLREHARHGPEFGLIKPLIIAKDDADAIAKAEWMTYVLLLERQPATFPAHGWDKLIFPIKLCRTYLDGIVPTHETIRSFFDRS